MYLRLSASPGAAVTLAKKNTVIDIRVELAAIRAGAQEPVLEEIERFVRGTQSRR